MRLIIFCLNFRVSHLLIHTKLSTWHCMTSEEAPWEKKVHVETWYAHVCGPLRTSDKLVTYVNGMNWHSLFSAGELNTAIMLSSALFSRIAAKEGIKASAVVFRASSPAAVTDTTTSRNFSKTTSSGWVMLFINSYDSHGAQVFLRAKILFLFDDIFVVCPSTLNV